MTSLLPAPLPLTSTAARDDQHDADEQHQSSNTNFDYDSLRSLIAGGRSSSSTSKQTQRVFCVSLPSIGGYRSLTEPIMESEKTMAAGEEMIIGEAEVVTAPSSPPDLSYSKSSKSSISSIPSDISSDDDSTEKLPQFEDVGLDEDVREGIDDCNVKPESRPTLRRLPKRSSSANMEVMHATVQMNGALGDRSLNLPQGRGMRRGFTSPTSSTMVIMAAPEESEPSRSPSPNRVIPQHKNSSSPQIVQIGSPRTSWSAPSPGLVGAFARRQSWQPGRKTAKQLEAEYDDGDEDVPDEAILENVPITPLPGQSFKLRVKTPSPNRKPSPSHSTLHSANVPKNAKRPSAPTIMPNGQYGAPRSPRHGRPPMHSHSATISSFSAEPFGHKHRSKSWAEDLNEEARALSAALEQYTGNLSAERRRSGVASMPSSPPRPSFSKMRSKTTVLELPPVQKGSIMIDPLPISKEKEAVLARTRPSWLPPKSRKEEKKHVKEWEQMMARAADAEKKKALRLREEEETKEEQQTNIARIWEEQVLPHWDVMTREPRTRELWWSGITPKSRALVWQKAIGNELQLSPSSFEAALRRANDMEEKVAEMPSEERTRSSQAAWLDAIERDVPNVYPDLNLFGKGQPLHVVLSDVLKAYAMYRSDVGYVFGIHLVASVLCMHMRAPEAFVTLANMLNRPLPLAFLVHDKASMNCAYDLVLSALKYKYTKLHSHLTSPALELKPEEFLDPLFRCLFAYNLSPEHVGRIWDIFVFEGDKALVRAAVAVLGRLEGKLYGAREEILDLISWRNEEKWDVGSVNEFIKAVRDAGKVDSRGEA
ncbi:hypothetical protein BAUCODRAFT_39523 [Baudoinia panamericana UAMH 10762]|uniref:Rab-GAP TBC domain-containing protein n=1 Tax=Baudoinia panamericana (strain UAMH 10762) TaxID=717646 RepID=M2MJ97_BAUPA|nr:uncharacterized protein BAUCODRAFT_39523 [Baudoinia panamericana UAMH 10762]EMC91353.1 hypothetical protein BAUCODRAFT_39523 [Baudoinia panamericana UAMH 10762]